MHRPGRLLFLGLCSHTLTSHRQRLDSFVWPFSALHLLELHSASHLYRHRRRLPFSALHLLELHAASHLYRHRHRCQHYRRRLVGLPAVGLQLVVAAAAAAAVGAAGSYPAAARGLLTACVAGHRSRTTSAAARGCTALQRNQRAAVNPWALAQRRAVHSRETRSRQSRRCTNGPYQV